MFEQLKSLLRDRVGLPPWLVLALAGLVAHLALNFVLRKAPASPWGLCAPLLLGIAIESWEIWVHYQAIGFDAPGVDPLAAILLRHALDVTIMLLGPLALVLSGFLASR